MSAWIIGICFVSGAILAGYLPARLLRRRYEGLLPADTRAVASDVMARIGVLHGLILSLVFASAHGGAQKFEEDVTAEASAATHVYFNALRYGAPELQAASIAYLRAAIDKDWPVLREREELSAEGWIAWRGMLEASLALQPEDRRERILAERMQADIWQVEVLRQARGYEAADRLSGEFWLVAIVGLVLIATLLFVHRITPLHQAIMAMYSGFTGLTLFLIYDMSHPFSGALIIEPVAFIEALDMIRAGI
ncbi:hypothetical protein CSC74_15185 [Pseudoxanthomonas yeongjuensis]|jgi:hypothetical protein|uniref:bestrophin-like domain n=1 Tax=Pseudoxanthomonas yeongjuensis TaxID=377616 RepID=UPI001392011B|nr:DUF4239 domain-containing protein [Pseudoxanthomonas yeongjuensis]KAF1714974.1 hypothetical protein CSC74_15185 [Pseudoxanthomonas yeongjuensis]